MTTSAIQLNISKEMWREFSIYTSQAHISQVSQTSVSQPVSDQGKAVIGLESSENCFISEPRGFENCLAVSNPIRSAPLPPVSNRVNFMSFA